MKKLIAWALTVALLGACAPSALCEATAQEAQEAQPVEESAPPAAAEEPEVEESPSPDPADTTDVEDDGGNAPEEEQKVEESGEPAPDEAQGAQGGGDLNLADAQGAAGPEPLQPPQEGGGQEPAVPPVGAPGQSILPVPSDGNEETPEPEDYAPQGEAWTELEDGTVLDDTLQAVLEEMLESDARATVYLTALGEYALTDIPMSLFDRVKLRADREALGEEDGPYEVQIEEGTLPPDAAPDALPEIVVTVARKKVEENDGEDPDGDPAQQPAHPTLAPGEVEIATPPPTDEPAEEPTPTPSPEPRLSVSVEGLTPGAWQNVPPTFTLSGIRPDEEAVYGVFVCGEMLVLLADGETTYVPTVEGEVSFRFAILDMMGDVQALSEQFDVWLDMTPPDGPYLYLLDESDIVAGVTATDALSGVETVSTDGGYSWQPFDEEKGGSVVGEKGEVVEPGTILARDRAGNVSANFEEFVFGDRPRVGGGGGGGKRIKHATQTTDYSLANYNALELVFPQEPTLTLTAGGTTLSLSMTADVGGKAEPAPFTARLADWQSEAGEQDSGNALVLTAEPTGESAVNVWSFSGDVYRLLYNSGVDYLVFVSGDYLAAVPTAGFTAGTAYAKMKAGGVSTRRFAYTLSQDEALRETTLSVQVEGETYLLEEDHAQPMYRYDVLVGPVEMMQKPYGSYLKRDQEGEAKDEE